VTNKLGEYSTITATKFKDVKYTMKDIEEEQDKLAVNLMVLRSAFKDQFDVDVEFDGDEDEESGG
jgi:transcription antitermination factor NusG